MGTQTAIDCPQCARHHTASIDFCECGYFLAWTASPPAEEAEEEGVSRIPFEEPVVEPEPPPVIITRPPLSDTAEIPVVTGPRCPDGHPNPPGRTLCEICGLPVGATKTAPARPPLVHAIAPSRPPRQIPWEKIGAAAGFFLLVGVGLAVYLLVIRPDSEPPEPRIIVEQALDLTQVSVVATSTLPDAGAISYAPSNLLDGDITTAWNNNSAASTPGPGEQLTFTFLAPVEVLRLEVVNGYAKDEGVFIKNNRVKGLTVTTDEGSFPATLLDGTTIQSVVGDFGTTSTLVITIDSIYEGTGFNSPTLQADLALSELSIHINVGADGAGPVQLEGE